MSVTLPNWITIARLVLSIVLFVVLANYDAARPDEMRALLIVGFWLYLVAAVSDFIDGELARRLGQITPFGRVMDPFVDKVLICGAFVCFAGHNFHHPEHGSITHVAPWMAIVILGRELFVTAVRTHSEVAGKPAAALWSGKMKMLVQSVTCGFVLGVPAFQLGFLDPVTRILVWATVAVTVISVFSYLGLSTSFLRDAGTQAVASPRHEPQRGEPASTTPRVRGAKAQEIAP